jgi:hypothetical protein
MKTSPPNEQIKYNNSKPTYDVGFWEYVYEKEQKPFLELIRKKISRLDYLEEKDVHNLPEQEAKSVCSQIKYLDEELNILTGIKIFTDYLKDCYLDSSIKIYNCYHEKNLQLQIENKKLKELCAALFQKLKPVKSQSNFAKWMAEREEAKNEKG